MEIKDMTERPYQFKLRKDMPPGFIENPHHPELPAMRSFLEQYQQHRYSSPEDFERLLSGYPEYRVKNNITSDHDEKINRGLFMEEECKDTYLVFCFDNGHSGSCVFGMLENKLPK
ncbi:MAG: hypothetical protein AABX47_02135 [Nanoarchaeota archaeon]